MKKIKVSVGLTMILLLCLVGILTPLIATNDPAASDLMNRLKPPGEAGILGTDHLGRDVFSRFIYGARLSVSATVAVLAISVVTGLFLGLVSGYAGGVCDHAIMSVIEILLAFPGMVLSLAIVSIFGAGLVNTALAVCLVSWIGYAKLVRGMTLTLKERDFVKAARLAGTSDFYIIVRHILPNVLTAVITYAATNISSIVMQIAALSFLGLGVQPPVAEWGSMLNEARGYMTTAPWLTLVPSLGLIYMISGFNLFGEGLAEYINAYKGGETL